MKDTITYKFCEFCNEKHEQSPVPPEADYQAGLISISDNSIVLLAIPKKSLHYEKIGGVYCGINCLVRRLKQIREWPSVENKVEN